MHSRPIHLLSGIVLLIFSSATVNADSFNQTYIGVLSSTSSIVEESVTLGSASSLLLTTSSYGGGSNSDGSTTSPGGFQPSLTIYTNSGSYIASQQASSPIAASDPITHLALDSYLSVSLNAGSYLVTLTNWQEQQPPTATNLSDGFINYGGPTFVDVSGATRTANYSLNVTADGAGTATPEPKTISITAIGFIGLMLARLVWTRRKQA